MADERVEGTVDSTNVAESDPCGICGLEADPVLLQMCFRCDSLYHLNPYSNREGIDCGDAVIGPELGVYYYCTPCLVVINDEINTMVSQEAQAMEVERRPGWTATPPAAPATPPPSRAEVPAPTDPPAAPPARRPAEAPPRRRFRRIDG